MKNLLRLSFIFFIISLIAIDGKCQNTTVSIGNWREHVPYNKAIEVAEDNNGLIYCATQFGVFTYSKSDGELNRLSRLKELSDQEVNTIRYDKPTGVLLIAYANSNIDMIYSDKTVVNLSDIKQKNIVGGKQINSIYFQNGFAYLGCGFGIVVIDISRREIKDTYYIGHDGSSINVNGVAYDGTYLLAATDSGIYKAVYTDPNIFNFNAWTKDTTLTEPNAIYSSATSLNGKFYVVKTNPVLEKDSVLIYDNNQWSPLFNDDTKGAHVDSYNNFLLYRNNYKMAALDGAGNTIRSLEGWVIAFPSFKRGFVDSDGNFWVADGNNGLLWKHTDGSISLIQPNGPRSEAAWAIAGKGGKLWVASGSMLGTDYSPYEKNGISRFADNDWHTFDCTNDSIYAYTCAFGSPAVVAVAIDPHNPDHAFIGSWGNGLLEYTKDGGIRHFLADNSALVPRYPSQLNFVQVGGVTFDDDGNLWAVSAGTTEGICVKTKDDVWQKFTLSEAATAGFGLYGLVIDDFGQKWFIARTASSGGEGVCVFKEKNLTSQYNGQYKRLNDRAGTGSLPDLFVRSIAKDKDGSIWLGTNKGVAVVYNPGNVFTGGSYDAQKIIIQQDGYNQYLLETESVNAIAIDGANRKWFGTYSGGVFLMSADATHQILNFNMDNSPLPSNYIASIAIDDLTGEVFFATDKGIISYRGDATEGGQQCENHYVFPNPVKHEYRGPIAIRGLVANADVKIADVAGNIVYHTKANGGEAIWYGNNMNGERAQTGVYIVYVTNEDGSETCTTKMLFAN